MEIIALTLGLRLAEGTKTLSSPGIKRSMDKVNSGTDLSEDNARTYRSVTNYLAEDRRDILTVAKEMVRYRARGVNFKQLRFCFGIK